MRDIQVSRPTASDTNIKQHFMSLRTARELKAIIKIEWRNTPITKTQDTF